MTRALYALGPSGTVRRLPCKLVQTLGPSGIVWWSCRCRPGIKTTDPARVLHAGDLPAPAAVPKPREEES